MALNSQHWQLACAVRRRLSLLLGKLPESLALIQGDTSSARCSFLGSSRAISGFVHPSGNVQKALKRLGNAQERIPVTGRQHSDSFGGVLSLPCSQVLRKRIQGQLTFLHAGLTCCRLGPQQPNLRQMPSLDSPRTPPTGDKECSQPAAGLRWGGGRGTSDKEDNQLFLIPTAVYFEGAWPYSSVLPPARASCPCQASVVICYMGIMIAYEPWCHQHKAARPICQVMVLSGGVKPLATG